MRRAAPCALGLLLLAMIPAAASAQVPIRVGQTLAGTLVAGDGVVAEDNSLYDDFVVQATPGQRLVITLRSDDFDTFLVWGTGLRAQFQGLANDDDGAGGTNSRLEVTATSARHTIRANALRAGMTGRYSLTVEAAGGGAVAAPPVAGAAGGGTIAAGQTVSGQLSASDQKLGDDSYYDQYVYRGRPGERIVVTMRSAAFDTYLYGGTLRGGAFQQAVTDDDGAGGTDSRIEATLSGDGVYAIRANSLSANQTGSYTLTVTSSVASAPSGAPSGARGTIAVGQSAQGRLERGDSRLADDNSLYDQYVIRGRPGESVIITMTSPDFDAFLRGGRLQGSQFQVTEYDDDSGGGTNARLQAVLDGSGTYALQANALTSEMTGSYTVSVEGGGAVTSGPATGRSTIALGQSVNGRLDTSDPKLADNSHYDQYVFRGTPGQQVLVTMISSAFDAYLTWGRANGNELQTEGNDDDSGGGTNAQLVATVPLNGSLVIQANSLGADQTGAYTLSVAAVSGARPRQQPVPTGAATVAAGQTVNGTLAATDRVLGDTSYFDQYVYQGNPGDRLRITLQSSAFDAFLVWGRVDGNALADAVQDDDGAGGTNSQLDVTVGGTGLYAIRANSFGPRQTGAYTLNVQRVSAATAGSPTPGGNRPSSGPSRPTGPATGGNKWRYAYNTTTNPNFRNLEQRMKRSQLLEMFAQQLSGNPMFELGNAQVEMRLAQCGNVNAFYSPRERAVTLCYELLEHLARRFVPSGQWTTGEEEAVRGAVDFIMMHEVGHALVHVLDLPITGREEDAVDQLATLMLVRTGDKGAEAALNGVLAIQPGRDAVFDQSDFADEHSLGPVRLFNVVCWIYGSEPSKYQALAQRAGLPQERARRCRDEYDQLNKSWTRLLERN